MLDLLRALIGEVPAGLEFLEYFFAFLLVLVGLFVVAYVAHLPIEFIGNRFHRR